MVLVFLVSIELVVWIVLVKIISGILEWVFLFYYIHKCALILRLVCPQFTKKIRFVKLTGKIQRKIVDSIMILLTTCITNTKYDWVTTKIIEIWIVWVVFSCSLKNLIGGGGCGPAPREGGGDCGRSCLYWEIVYSAREELLWKIVDSGW